LMDLRTVADWTVRLRLLAVPGVASVTVFGGDKRSIQVQVHPDELIRYNLTLNDVLNVARRSTGVRGAGFVDTRNQRIVFQTEGQSLKPDDIARTVLLSRGAASITLGNVADVVDAPEPPIGGASIQGGPGVVLNVAEQYAADTLKVTQKVEAALEELRPALEADGLAIAIGVVVDDAVIDVENIVRRLRENRRSPQPRPSARVVLDATLEVRSAVVYATFAVILVVLPVMTLSGTAGRLFAPLGFAYSMAVLASLVVALTVTPALAMALLPGRVPTRDPPTI